ncbi:MAG: hypothetical protein ABJD11_01765 [Gemmatimonadota bacterium]
MSLRWMVFAVCLAGCHATTHDSSAARTREPAVRSQLRLVASDFAFGDLPNTLSDGPQVIRLVNRGHFAHLVEMTRLDSGRTAADLYAAVKANRQPAWAVDVGGPNAIFPGDSATVGVSLTPGHYAVVCWVPDSSGVPHLLHGMISTLVVSSASGPPAVEAPADDTLRLSNYRVELLSSLAAGAHVVRMENVDVAGAEHDLFVIRLHTGTTEDEALTWLDNFKGAARPFDVVGGSSAIMPGGHAEVYLELTPGRYLILCTMPDPKDSRGHYRHGMMKSFAIPS